MAWTFRGHTEHIDRAADRLRVRRVVSDRIKAPPRAGTKRAVPDIASLGRSVAGMCLELQGLERLGQPVSDRRRARIASDLRVLDQAVSQYHVLAAAAAAMIDESAAARGLPAPVRPVRIECDHDQGVEP